MYPKKIEVKKDTESLDKLLQESIVKLFEVFKAKTEKFNDFYLKNDFQISIDGSSSGEKDENYIKNSRIYLNERHGNVFSIYLSMSFS